MKIEKFFANIFWIFLIFKALESFFPFGHGDALYYHLVFPKILLESGWLDAHNELSGAFQSGLMEYFYLIPQLLFKDLLWAQRFSQFMHFFFSIGISSILIWSFFKKEQPLLASLAGLSFLTFNRGGDFFLFAKNDGITPTLILLYYFIFLSEKKTWIQRFDRPFLAGILLGLIPLFKINGFIPSAFLGLAYAYKERKKIYNILFAFFPCLVLSGMILLRNWYFLKSPFFPGLLKYFPGIIPAPMLETFLFYASSPINAEAFLSNIKLFFLAKTIFLFIPIFSFFYIKKLKKLPLSLVLSLLIFTLAMITNGGISAERFLFPCYFLNLIFIIEFCFEFSLSFQSQWKNYVCLLMIMLDSKIDIVFRRIYKNFQYLRLPSREVIIKMSPKSQVWEKLGLQTLDKKKVYILSDEWNEMFYAPKGVRVFSSEATIQAGFFPQCTRENIPELSKYDFYIIKRWQDNPCYTKIKTKSQFLFEYDHYSFFKRENNENF